MSRPVSCAPLLVSITLALAAGAAPLAAQRSDEPARATRSPVGEPAEQQARRLMRTADSIKRRFDDEDLSAAERRELGEALDRTVLRLRDLSDQVTRWSERAEPGATFTRVQVGPLSRAGADMARSLTQTIGRDATPQGWIGIVVSGAIMETRVDRGELLLRYLSYPLIASVDPSSPAQRAGIAPNDTLLAYDGRDVRDAYISMTRLLQPNAKVTVRVRRDGRTRDLPVVVAEAPSRIRQRRNEESRELQAPWVVAGVPNSAAFPRMPAAAPVVMGGPPRAPRPPAASFAPGLPAMPPTSMAFTFVTNGIAGAMMVTVSEGLGRTLGVSSGVLVANAPVSSPAAESGLRDGDVIVRVERQEVRSVSDVRELVAHAAQEGERSVEVEYLREKRVRKATLRW